MAGRKRLWLRRIIWALVFVPLTLLWGELFTRVLLPQNVDTVLDILHPDPVLGYVYEPGARHVQRGREYDVPFDINSLGLRDREYDPKDEDAVRVLLMGDSFSLSHGETLANSLPAQVERALVAGLRERGRAAHVEVINGSNGGYTPYHYWKGYRRWREPLRPDLVLVGLYTGNDYVSEDPDVRFLIKDGLVSARYHEGETPPVRRRSPVQVLRKKLARGSELYVLLRNYLYYNENVDRLLRGRRSSGNVVLEQLQPFLVPAPERVTSGCAKTAGYLERLREEAGSDGVPVLVLRIPTKMEVVDERYREFRATYALGAEQIDRGQPARDIAAFCAELGLPLVDPLPAIAARHAETDCFFTYDDHWNAAAMEAASTALVSRWRELDLPPFGDSASQSSQE